jgi:dTDP-glucose 4,6-dehydratase
MTMKKLLVIGSAGFIGGNFVQYMVNKYPHYDINNLDVLTYAGDLTKHRAIETKDNYHFVKVDIADREAIMGLFEKEKFDYVFHFVAESHVDRSITDPVVFIRTNVVGTQVLLDAAKQIGISKFVHV